LLADLKIVGSSLANIESFKYDTLKSI